MPGSRCPSTKERILFTLMLKVLLPWKRVYSGFGSGERARFLYSFTVGDAQEYSNAHHKSVLWGLQTETQRIVAYRDPAVSRWTFPVLESFSFREQIILLEEFAREKGWYLI